MSERLLTSKGLYDHVVEEYRNNDVELNSLFFDVEVEMKKADIISVYAELQSDINGDLVCRYEGGAEMEKLIPDDEYQDIYKGNCKEFLESFNNQERFRRYTDDGERLDFVF